MTAGLAYANLHSIAASDEQRRLTPEEAVAELFETAREDVYRYLLTLGLAPAQAAGRSLQCAQPAGIRRSGAVSGRPIVRAVALNAGPDAGQRLERPDSGVPDGWTAVVATGLARAFPTAWTYDRGVGQIPGARS
jgi:hypothetical protein